MLNELKGHSVRNIIVTNKPEGALRRILGSKGWANLFDDWICPDSIPGREATKVEMIAEIVRRHGIARDNASMWETPSATSKLHGPTASPA